MKVRPAGPAGRVANLYARGRLPLVIRGLEFGLRDLRVILSCSARYRHRGRTFISQEICRQLNWRQPNGWLKERACRDVLRVLHRRRLVRLPRPLVRQRQPAKRYAILYDRRLQHIDLKTPVHSQPKVLRLEFVKGNEAGENVWNYLVDKYHYLAYKASVGRSLKYLVWADDRLVGAISFCSPVWRLKPRDDLLEKVGVSVGDLHERVINNNRFLILPNVQVAHLASRVLARATEAAFKDWSWYYGIVPLVAETFVAPSRFDGTCYLAANWLRVGTTRGFTKRGPTHRNGQERKHLFLYGLKRAVRLKLAELVSSIAQAEGPEAGRGALSRRVKGSKRVRRRSRGARRSTSNFGGGAKPRRSGRPLRTRVRP